MATRLKIVEQLGADLDAPKVPQFTPAPTRNQHAGWTAERQRAFIAFAFRPELCPFYTATPTSQIGSASWQSA